MTRNRAILRLSLLVTVGSLCLLVAVNRPSTVRRVGGPVRDAAVSPTESVRLPEERVAVRNSSEDAVRTAQERTTRAVCGFDAPTARPAGAAPDVIDRLVKAVEEGSLCSGVVVPVESEADFLGTADISTEVIRRDEKGNVHLLEDPREAPVRARPVDPHRHGVKIAETEEIEILERRFQYQGVLVRRLTEVQKNAEAGAPSRVVEIRGRELLVKLRGSREQIEAGLRKEGFEIAAALGSGWYRVSLPLQVEVEAAVARMKSTELYAFAEPDYLVHSSAPDPNDPRLAEQWALHNTGQTGGTADADIDAREAWAICSSSRSTMVAVLDTGADYTHPDLSANLAVNGGEIAGDGIDNDGNGYKDDVRGYDFANNDADPMDDNFHGTHVSGIIGAAGNNGIGVIGVAWQASILPVKFLDANGSGWVSNSLRGIDYALSRGAKVFNASYGGGGYSQAEVDALTRIQQRGGLFVAAAGNGSSNNDSPWVSYPSSYALSGVIAVASTDALDQKSSFSNYGAISVDLGAPGTSILSTMPMTQTSMMRMYGLQAQYERLSGTSMAAPHVAGSCALLMSFQPTLSGSEVKSRILFSTDPVGALAGKCLTGGRLNIDHALRNQSQPQIWAGITSPLASTIAPNIIHPLCVGTEIRGIAQATGFSRFTLEAGMGETPTLYTTNGVVPVNGGLSPVVEGKLADWTPSAATEGVWMLRLTVYGSSGSKTYLHRVWVDPQLKRGFPTYAWYGGGQYHAGPAIHTLVGDIDGDSEKEIVGTSLAQGPIHAWKANGALVRGFPIDSLAGAGYPALGRLSSNAPGQQVASGHFGSLYYSGTVAAYSGNGTFLPGWPKTINYVASPPSMADVDGDGIAEIFVEEEDWKLHGYKADGTPLPGWPVSQNVGGQEFHTPAIGDIDGDGVPEIVSATGSSTPGVYLFAWRVNGTVVGGFPVLFPNYGYPDTYPVLGDVDGDGQVDIVALQREPAAPWRPILCVISGSGVIRRSWYLNGSIRYGAAPALADLNGDGVPEILVQTDSSLEAFQGSGTAVAGFPKIWSGYWSGDSAPVVGDVDGDQSPDIVITLQVAGSGSLSELRIYDRNGNVKAGFPKATRVGSGSVPAIADMDGDGRNEVILLSSCTYGIAGMFPHILAWDFNAPGTKSGGIEWGQFGGDASHTGRYRSTVRRAPTVALAPAVQSGRAGQTLAYTVTLTNNDGKDAAPSMFSLSSAVPKYWTGTFSAASVTLAPGKSASVTMWVRSYSYAGAGTYGIRVNVSDPAEPKHAAFATGQYQVTTYVPSPSKLLLE